jgi:hypothetical protein
MTGYVRLKPATSATSLIARPLKYNIILNKPATDLQHFPPAGPKARHVKARPAGPGQSRFPAGQVLEIEEAIVLALQLVQKRGRIPLTEAVSSRPGEKGHWSQKWQRNTPNGGEKPWVDWKMDLQTSGERRESRKSPMPMINAVKVWASALRGIQSSSTPA